MEYHMATRAQPIYDRVVFPSETEIVNHLARYPVTEDIRRLTEVGYRQGKEGIIEKGVAYVFADSTEETTYLQSRVLGSLYMIIESDGYLPHEIVALDGSLRHSRITLELALEALSMNLTSALKECATPEALPVAEGSLVEEVIPLTGDANNIQNPRQRSFCENFCNIM